MGLCACMCLVSAVLSRCRFTQECMTVCVPVGASEIVLRRSTSMLWPTQSAGRDDRSTNRIVRCPLEAVAPVFAPLSLTVMLCPSFQIALTADRARYLEREVIHTFATQSLRTIGLGIAGCLQCSHATICIDWCVPVLMQATVTSARVKSCPHHGLHHLMSGSMAPARSKRYGCLNRPV